MDILCLDIWVLLCVRSTSLALSKTDVIFRSIGSAYVEKCDSTDDKRVIFDCKCQSNVTVTAQGGDYA